MYSSNDNNKSLQAMVLSMSVDNKSGFKNKYITFNSELNQVHNDISIILEFETKLISIKTNTQKKPQKA